MTKNTDITKNRPKRIPLNEQKRNILTATDQDPNFKYRWVNDTGDRIERFKLAGWEVVSHNTLVGDANQNAAIGTGGRANVGAGMQSILMRISKEFYLADQAAKQKKIADMESLMLRKKSKQSASDGDGTYGDVSLEVDVKKG